MNAHDAYRPTGFTGEFESEICVPVRVRYAVDAEGRVEVLHVAPAGAAAAVETTAALVWPHLALRERRALEHEAEEEARYAVERS